MVLLWPNDVGWGCSQSEGFPGRLQCKVGKNKLTTCLVKSTLMKHHQDQFGFRASNVSRVLVEGEVVATKEFSVGKDPTNVVIDVVEQQIQ